MSAEDCVITKHGVRAAMPRSRNACVIVLMFALVACGGRSAASPTAARSGGAHVAEVAGSQPSASARMICASEGKGDIAATIGVEPARPLIARWGGHVYACDYVYGDGQVMTLSVKELSSATETTNYFDELGRSLGRMHALQGLGQDAYQTSNGSTVVRKDFLVLLVDVSQIPSHFGTPSSPRADVSLSVAATIMGCWTGA